MILPSYTRNFRQPRPEPSSRRMALQKWCGRRTPRMRRVTSSLHGYAGKPLRWAIQQNFRFGPQSKPETVPYNNLGPVGTRGLTEYAGFTQWARPKQGK